jgi:27-O-demethylrifamycin SV methyltransferase
MRPLSESPTVGDVGHMYDALTDTVTRIMDGCIHFGYWRDELDDSPLNQASERLTDLVIEKSQAREDDHILDVGCGTGIPALRLATSTGARVTGITVSGHQVKIAKANAQAAGVGERVTFQFADAMALPFPDASFDAAIAIESLMHMSDPAAALAHIARTLRKDGRLVVTDFLLRRPVSDEKKNVFDSTAALFAVSSPTITAEDYRRIVEHVGLELEELTDIGENVQRTYALWADAFKSNETVARYLGSKEKMDATIAFLENRDYFQEIGYVLLIAKRVDTK